MKISDSLDEGMRNLRIWK